MKPGIFYLYEYNGTKKLRNAGFLKITRYYHSCTLQLNARGIPVSYADTIKLCAFYPENEQTTSAVLTEITCANHSVSARMSSAESRFPTGQTLDTINGFFLPLSNGHILAAAAPGIAVDAAKLLSGEPKNRPDSPSPAREPKAPSELEAESIHECNAEEAPEPAPDRREPERESDAVLSESSPTENAGQSRENRFAERGDRQHSSTEQECGHTQNPPPEQECNHMQSPPAEQECGHTQSSPAEQECGHTQSPPAEQEYNHMQSPPAEQECGHTQSSPAEQECNHGQDSPPEQKCGTAQDSPAGQECQTEQDTLAEQASRSSQNASADQPSHNVKKIQRSEMSILPRRYWHLANNSFLLHGYHNYNHLLLIEKDGHYWLGVPGIYDPHEARAARLFGFPQFTDSYNDSLQLTDDECNPNANFGYWCCYLKSNTP